MRHGDPSVSPAEWRDLILEFEARSEAARRASPSSPERPISISPLAAGASDHPLAKFNTDERPVRPTGRALGRENPAQYESMNLVESGMMTALTALLWLVGRVFRFDSFLITFYPLPSLYIMMRWGPVYGNLMLISTFVLIQTLLGPFLGLQYALNTGLLVLAFGNTMWYQWHWGVAIAAGCLAKFVGLFLNITWTSALLRYNTWKLVSEQVQGTIQTFGGFYYKIAGKDATFAGPTTFQVTVGVAVLLGLHSLFQVVFTHLSTTMILDRLHDKGVTKRSPRMLPLLTMIKKLAKKSLDEVEDGPFRN